MKKELLEIIVRDAFVKKPVKLSSGKMSDFYIDVRRVSLDARGLHLMSFLIWDMIKNDNITAPRAALCFRNVEIIIDSNNGEILITRPLVP